MDLSIDLQKLQSLFSTEKKNLSDDDDEVFLRGLIYFTSNFFYQNFSEAGQKLEQQTWTREYWPEQKERIQNRSKKCLWYLSKLVLINLKISF